MEGCRELFERGINSILKQGGGVVTLAEQYPKLQVLGRYGLNEVRKRGAMEATFSAVMAVGGT